MREDSTENLRGPEKQISALLKNLPRVESTGNFEAKVRSRIAIAKDTPQRKWLVPTVAVSTFLVLFTAGIAFWPPANSGELATTQAPTEVVDSIPVSPFAESNGVISEPVNPAPTSTLIAGREIAAERRRIAPRKDVRNRSYSRQPTEPSQGGSEVRLLTPAPMINANVSTKKPLLLSDYFQMIGAEGSFEKSGWAVSEVAPNSLASRAGIVQGDIVESIGSVRVVEGTTLEGTQLDNKVEVRRGSELKTFDLRKP